MSALGKADIRGSRDVSLEGLNFCLHSLKNPSNLLGAHISRSFRLLSQIDQKLPGRIVVFRRHARCRAQLFERAASPREGHDFQAPRVSIENHLVLTARDLPDCLCLNAVAGPIVLSRSPEFLRCPKRGNADDHFVHIRLASKDGSGHRALPLNPLKCICEIRIQRPTCNAIGNEAIRC